MVQDSRPFLLRSIPFILALLASPAGAQTVAYDLEGSSIRTVGPQGDVFDALGGSMIVDLDLATGAASVVASTIDFVGTVEVVPGVVTIEADLHGSLAATGTFDAGVIGWQNPAALTLQGTLRCNAPASTCLELSLPANQTVAFSVPRDPGTLSPLDPGDDGTRTLAAFSGPPGMSAFASGETLLFTDGAGTPFQFLTLRGQAVPNATTSLLTVPPANAIVEGDTAEDVSFDDPPGRTAQWVYAEALLTHVPIGARITGLRFRLNGGGSFEPDQETTWPSYTVTVARSLNPPNALSLTYADNLGADATLVRSGPLTFAAGSFPAGDRPNTFGPLIPFDTPYTYTGGDLLVMVTHPGSNEVVVADAEMDAELGGVFGSSGGSSALVSLGRAPVVQLELDTPVPAPVPMLAVGGRLALAALLVASGVGRSRAGVWPSARPSPSAASSS